ncbi:hypothetical protein NL676_026611 [Syzygium grande]|nr:hypothetical protein NL676_026611 [Syzygium grande]
MGRKPLPSPLLGAPPSPIFLLAPYLLPSGVGGISGGGRRRSSLLPRPECGVVRTRSAIRRFRRRRRRKLRLEVIKDGAIQFQEDHGGAQGE